MIAQAGIGPGARVLEIGTTGYNAALIAEVAGPGGHVVTLDIDPEVPAGPPPPSRPPATATGSPW